MGNLGRVALLALGAMAVKKYIKPQNSPYVTGPTSASPMGTDLLDASGEPYQLVGIAISTTALSLLAVGLLPWQLGPLGDLGAGKTRMFADGFSLLARTVRTVLARALALD